MVQQQDSSDPTGVSAPARANSSAPGIDTATRARQRKANAAIQLKLAGATWEEIAESLGFPTPRAALVATEKALETQLASSSDREAMRQLAGQRIERLLRAVWPKAIDPNHPEQMQAQSAAASRIDRHIKLFGLDAPTEIVVHSPTQSELEAWVDRITKQAMPDIEEFDIIEGEVLADYEQEDWTEDDDALPA
jgi:hypothetical protein